MSGLPVAGHRMTDLPLISLSSVCASIIPVPLCEDCRCHVKEENGKRQLLSALYNKLHILSV